jgi:GT2 family glycosyltransferase
VTTSVVVVSYRPGQWLAPCLASVATQADEVLLLDNGSEGASASRIGLEAGATVVRSEFNRGFAPACNEGAHRARGDVLALLNDDALASPGWLTAATEVLKDPSVAAVGPKVVLSDRYREVVYADPSWHVDGDDRPLGRQLRSVEVNGAELLEGVIGPGAHRMERNEAGDRWRWTAGPKPWYIPLPDGADIVTRVNGEVPPPGPEVRLVNSAGLFLDRRGYAGDIGIGTADDGRFDKAGERFALSGTAFVTRMSTWREVGPFAGRFFAYYEDVDWCWRARLAGMRLVYDPAATVEHKRSASSGGEHQPWVRVMAERNRTLVMVRNGPRHLAAAALRDRAARGPDGGVRAGIARLLPWALVSRARLARHWELRPHEVWDRWAGQDLDWPDGPAGTGTQR